MVRTVRDALVTALEELEKNDLKRFCNKIRDREIDPQYSKIPRSRLENTDAEDIVTILLDYYRNQYGAQLTVDVLKDINQNRVAEELEDNLAQVSGCSDKKPRGAEPTSDVMPPPAPKTKKVHFVDKHREALIQGVSLIDPILDSLLSKDLLTDEQYDTIRSERRPQERVRELFSVTKSWGEQDKDTFYQALKTHNRPLIDHLEKS